MSALTELLYQAAFEVLEEQNDEVSTALLRTGHVGLFRIEGNERLGLGIVDLDDGSTVIVNEDEATALLGAITHVFPASNLAEDEAKGRIDDN